MRMERLRAQFRAASAITAAALVAACGGGGSDEPAAPTPPSGVTLSGKAVDGPLQGATACYDTNDNRTCDSGEPASAVPSDAAGNFSIDVPAAAAGQHRLIVNVPATAVDADDGQPVGTAFTLIAPATGSAGAQSVFVSPLTTLVQRQMDSAGHTKDQAVAFVQSQLALAVSPLADFTASSSADNTKAANAARLTMATQLQQSAALAAAVGQADLSGGTVTQADVDAFVGTAVAGALPMIGGAATDATLAGQTGAALRAAVTTLATNVIAQIGLTVPEAVGAVGVAKLPPDPPSTEAPTTSGSLAALRYTSATDWYMRTFQSTAADNTPDANNLVRSYDTRTRTEAYAYAPGNPPVVSWALLNDSARAGDRFWNGSTWRTCDVGTRITGTVRDANGRSNYNYCDGYERGVTVRAAPLDIAGQTMASVLTTRIRTLAGGSSGVNYADWGPADLALLGSATFPAGSRLYYQTGTPLESAYAYDVRASNQVMVYSAEVAAGGDGRTGSPACAGTLTPTAATSLEEMVARTPGQPCIFGLQTNADGNSTDPRYGWGLTSLSLGVVTGANILPAGTGNYYSTNARLRVTFAASGNGTTYHSCYERRADGATQNCAVIGSGTYSIATLGDARVMSFANLPAAAGRLTYERVYVERGGRVYYGYRNAVGVQNAQVRLNMPAANAMLAQLGLPLLQPADAPGTLTGTKATTAATLAGLWAVSDAGGATTLLRFGADGRYLHAQAPDADATGRPGLELGWADVDLAATRQTGLLLELDTNGQFGLSHPLPTDRFTAITASAITFEDGSTIGRFPDSGTGLVGVWSTDPANWRAPMFAFFPSGRVLSVHPYAETTGACATARQGPPGVEHAPYTFDAATGALSIGPRTLDTSGCTGLWDVDAPAGSLFSATVTIAADGRTATVTIPGEAPLTLHRIAVQ